ncbi:hypothetical protein [Actinocrispum sp. NPDC049592]|uniref:hypothetical protein n=1 Tax=Actinocrispum sp. NPDC049592 TaxID=3154835 RepID=UPI003434DAA9
MADNAILDEIGKWAEQKGRTVVLNDVRTVLELSRDELDRAEPGDLEPGDMATLLDVMWDQLQLDTVEDATSMVQAAGDLLAFLGDTERIPADRALALADELAEGEDEFIEDVLDMGEDGEPGLFQQMLAALGLPVDVLPPIRLPELAELAEQARRSPVLAQAWQSYQDGDESHLVAQLEFDDEQRVWPAEDDEIAYDLWARATGVLVLGSPEDESDELLTSRLAVYLSAYLARGAGAPLGSLLDGATADGMRPWLDRLVEHGALRIDDDRLIMTPLGLSATRDELLADGVEVDLIPGTDELTPAYLAMLAFGVPETEYRQELAAWLALREPVGAAMELLALAAEGDAVERVWATSVAADLDAEAVWQELLEHEVLRPYARMALGEPLDTADQAWYAVDTVAAGVSVGDPERAAASVEASDESLFDAMWRVRHPDAEAVLSYIGHVHPDKRIAKLARRAADKAVSAQKPMP